MARRMIEMLVYRLKKPTLDGRTERYLSPLELLDRLAKLIPPSAMTGAHRRTQRTTRERTTNFDSGRYQ